MNINNKLVPGKKSVVAALCAVLTFATVNYNQSGLYTRVQSPLVGYKWVQTEGFYAKMPFLSSTKSYSQNGTVAVTDNESIIETASAYEIPRNIQFSDSYQMRLEYSFRYELSTNPDILEDMHQKVKTEQNLLGNTILPFALTLAADTAQQVEAGNFTQGGRNEFRTLMNDQSANGLFVTRVEQTAIEAEQADTESDRDAGTTKKGTQYIRKVVYIEDDQGKRLRTPLSIAEYGIKVVPDSIAIIEAEPIGRLVTYIDKKQENIALQISEEESQKLLRQQAKTAQLTGAKELVTSTNELNIAKANAIIKQEQELEVARVLAQKEIVEQEKVASLAIIDKRRELQIAKDNEGIQRANALAARYEAEAIKEKGFAEAAVDKAKYQAIDKEVLRLEVTKATQLALYNSNVKVTMPTIVGGGNEANSLETFTSLSVIEKLGKSK